MNDTPTTPPSSPAAAGAEPFMKMPPKRVLAAGILFVFSSIAVPVVTMMMIVQPATSHLEAAIASLRDTERDQQHALERQADALDRIATPPPTNDKLFGILGQGVGVTEDELRTTSVGTTPDAAFATDLTTSEQTAAFTQEILVKNTHATQSLCVKGIAWSSGGGATCALKCAAATITCSGAATDGLSVTAGSAVPRRLDGTNCVCVVGSGAGTTYQSERVIR